MIPPGTAVRRCLTLPAVVAVQCAVVLLSPLLVACALLLSVLVRSSRPWRTAALLVAYAAIELVTIGRLLGARSDPEPLVRDVAAAAVTAVARILHVTVRVEPDAATPATVGDTDGLIVLARHCGPGDTIFVVWLLAVHYALSVRVVLRRLMRVDPAIDVAADRLPWCFVGGDGSHARRGVADVAGDLSRGSALLLFPEGGNFTWRRWHEAVTALSARGEHLRARLARRRTHTLPPRPGGALAALQAAPHAAVLLVTHTGFARDGRDRRWWRVPMGRELVLSSYLVPAEEVPRDEWAQREFLDRCWSQVDSWVESHADQRMMVGTAKPPRPISG